MKYVVDASVIIAVIANEIQKDRLIEITRGADLFIPMLLCSTTKNYLREVMIPTGGGSCTPLTFMENLSWPPKRFLSLLEPYAKFILPQIMSAAGHVRPTTKLVAMTRSSLSAMTTS